MAFVQQGLLEAKRCILDCVTGVSEAFTFKYGRCIKLNGLAQQSAGAVEAQWVQRSQLTPGCACLVDHAGAACGT